MRLTPEVNVPELYQGQTLPSRTYRFDPISKRVQGMIDGIEAIKQFIYKTIRTPRFRYSIYSAAYGCEVENIIGDNASSALKESEIVRVITDALIYDDRVSRVYDFDININVDKVKVEFSVDTVEGVILVEEVFESV